MSDGFDTAFNKVWGTSCEVYTVQSMYTGQGPCTVHVYTQPWAEHSQEKSKIIGMSVDVAVICSDGSFVRTKNFSTKTFPDEAYFCLQVCALIQYHYLSQAK